MDGEDGRFVESLQGELQAALHLRVLDAACERGFDELAHEGVGAGRSAFEHLQHFANARADAAAELGGRRLGEGHHQQGFDRQLTLEQQAQIEAADVPGLSGASRSLDEADAIERALEDVEFRGGGHRRREGTKTEGSTAWSKAVARAISRPCVSQRTIPRPLQ